MNLDVEGGIIMITLSHVEKNYGLEEVLKDFSMVINSGEKVGLIGPNGSGKSTVFKLVSGIEQPNQGTVAVRRSLGIGYLKQIPARCEGETVEQRLWVGAEKLKIIEKRLRELEDLMAELTPIDSSKMENYMKEYARLTQDFESNRGYTFETKMKQIVQGLGLNIPFTSLITSLSGGEMARLELAVLLLSEPDILLLDEPTNHLDFSAISWLEEYLNQFEGTVIIISHDRYFLDKTVKRIVEIKNGKEDEYSGNYSYYLEERKKRFELTLKKYLNQEKEIKRKEEAIKRLRHWGHIGNNEKMFKQAFNIERQIERMEKIEHPSRNETQFQLQFGGERSGKEVLICKNVKKAYGENKIFDDLNLKIFYGERIGLIGPNGSGKTTLLKMFIENLKLDAGEVRIGSNVQIGYFDQHQELLDIELTLLDSLRRDIKLSESRVRSILAKYGFNGKQVFKQVKELSGGERSRFILLKMVYSQVNFLILDEPTNHLDLLSIEILEEALKDFTGTLLVVSHDRYFLNQVISKIVVIENKRLVTYLGNYDYYQQKLKDQQERVASLVKKKMGQEKFKNYYVEKKYKKNGENYPARGNPDLKKTQKIKHLQSRLKQLELEIESYENELEKNNVLMVQPEVFEDFQYLRELKEENDKIEAKLTGLWDEWEELSEELD